MKKSDLVTAFAFTALTALSSSIGLAACYNGWATPTSIKYNFSSLSANNDQGTSASLITDPFSVTFNRTDSNFAGTAVSDITLPFGRYVSVGLCYDGSVDVKLDGVKLDGNGSYNCSETSPLAAGSTIYSINATNGNGAVATSGTAVATKFTDNMTGCTITYFPAPLCVTDTTQVGCKAGDLVYTGTGAADNTLGEGKGKGAVNAAFKISLMADLYDGVVIDGGVGKILGVPPIFAIVGDPGAAIHINVPQSASGGTVPFNASLLFGPDKSLLSALVSQGNGAVGGSPLTYSCQGGNNVAVTGAPSSFPYGRLGYVSTSANSGKGQVIFPSVSSCQSTSTCNSAGAEVIDNPFQVVGSSATISCVADSATSYQTQKFGANYVGGAGAASGSNTAKIVRIVDPGNIFGVCTSSPCVDTTIATGAGGYF